MKKIVVKDKTFEEFISAGQIQNRVAELGKKIEQDFGEEVVFVGVLKGCFVFMADLVREINLPTQCEFLKISSYSGMESTGQVKTSLGISEDLIQGKNVVIVEDIVDTGVSMDFLIS